MNPLVIDLREINAEVAHLEPCDLCRSFIAVVVEGDGWEVAVMHDTGCSNVGPRPSLFAIPGGSA